MNLTDRERKILWTKAGNRCSFNVPGDVCSQTLCLDAGNGNVNVVVGEECHIVGEKKGAARYVEHFFERDSYVNAILLCPMHHKFIDDEQTRAAYPAEALREMKRRHEMKIEELVRQSPGSKCLILNDVAVTTEVDSTRRAVGMEVNVPAILSNVNTTLKVKRADEAVGFTTNQGLTSVVVFCGGCGNPIPLVCTGPMPATTVCPRCRRQQQLR